MKKLSSKEQLFCNLYTDGLNSREAAYKAGYTVCPEICSKKLLNKKIVRDCIDKISREKLITQSEVKAGLHRIAFAPSADAVKLILTENPSDLDIEALDLFNIAEIKKPKGGGLEVKFFDRIKALEKLSELTQNTAEQSAGCISFYQALENSAYGQDDSNEI